VVEGGTLLRCYTSQRGIEGSNPSSSAPKAPRLQEQREGEEADRERTRPSLHQRLHQRSAIELPSVLVPLRLESIRSPYH
jgi:hypothetical protein